MASYARLRFVARREAGFRRTPHGFTLVEHVGQAVPDIRDPREPCQAKPDLHGFTLVELLVVIVIISMLAALMLPALGGARARARIAQCTNNQKEIAKAIQQYEVAKKRMPGYINRLGTHAVSWVPVLFPYLGRMDLWEDDGWRRLLQATATPANLPRVRVSQLVCPDADATEPCALTYVLNIGTAYDVGTQENDFYADATTVPSATPPAALTGPGVFRNMVPVVVGTVTVQPKPLSMTDIKSSSQRPMLSERQYPLLDSTGVAGMIERVWNGVAGPLTGNAQGFATAELTPGIAPQWKLTPSQLGFAWPLNATGPITAPFVNSAVAGQQTTLHPGIVIVTFCDGHTELLADDVQCNLYDSKSIP